MTYDELCKEYDHAMEACREADLATSRLIDWTKKSFWYRVMHLSEGKQLHQEMNRLRAIMDKRTSVYFSHAREYLSKQA